MMTAHVFDRKSLLERTQGDEEFAGELLEMFLEDAQARLTAIRQAHKAADMKTITLEAHTIKGAAGNVGAECVRETAFQVEMAVKEQNLQSLPSLIQQLDEAFGKFRQALAD